MLNNLSGGSGGAIFIWSNFGQFTTVSHCAMLGNDSQQSGGAIYTTGSANNTLQTLIDNCLIEGNTTGEGGGIGAGDFIHIRSSTIVGNSSDEGGGLWFSFSTNATVTNSIVWDNTAPLGSDRNSAWSSTSTWRTWARRRSTGSIVSRLQRWVVRSSLPRTSTPASPVR